MFARVRPFNLNDGVDLSSAVSIVSITQRGQLMTITKPERRTGGGSERTEEFHFSFDKNFGTAVTQEEVFAEVSEFVQSALDGYNVCLFSYGQTGSGKTYTMQGGVLCITTHFMICSLGLGNGSLRGIIPRAMEQVGRYKLQLEDKGWEYSMEVSFIEIYNENVRDLLRDSSSDNNMRHEIKRDENGATYISDITMLELNPNNPEEIEEIMELASKYRSVGATNMNELSSRSHAVFTLYLRAMQKEQQLALNGTLNLVDLAGSERIEKSGAAGERAKEAVHINRSLAALADVFTAIGNKQSFVPFRNSKLTYLLQPALSGEGKTLMVCTKRLPYIVLKRLTSAYCT